jgi:hypothetical protein
MLGTGAGRTRIARLAALAVTACLTAPAAAAPLDPPPPRLVVLLVERASPAAPPLTLDITLTPTHDWGTVLGVGFRQRGRHRDVLDGEKSFYIEARRGGEYPSVVLGGTQQLPPCPAGILCWSPPLPGEYFSYTFTPQDADLSHYLFVTDVPHISFTVSSGWRIREVGGGDLLQFRETGTAVRASAYNRQYMVEDFRGVVAPRVRGPSVAFATIPCWYFPLPGGPGRATLRNDGRETGFARRMRCESYRDAASGGSQGPAVWHNEGESTGWSGGFVMRLVVAVLPPP